MKALMDRLESIEIGPVREAEDMRVVPLLATNTDENALLLTEALIQGLVDIEEVSEAGRVNRIRIINRGKLPILALDGEELRGSKQNRVLNTSLRIGAGQTVVVPVSCVESGRWRWTSRRFETTARLMPSRMRQKKMARVSQSLRARGVYDANQQAVWDDTSTLLVARRVLSETTCLSDALDRIETDGQAPNAPQLDLTCLRPREGEIGQALFIGDRLISIEVFGTDSLCASAWPHLESTLRIESALNPADRPSQRDAKDLAQEVRGLLQDAVNAHRDTFIAPGGSSLSVRLTSQHAVGAALLREKDVLHCTVYASVAEGERPNVPDVDNPRSCG